MTLAEYYSALPYCRKKNRRNFQALLSFFCRVTKQNLP